MGLPCDTETVCPETAIGVFTNSFLNPKSEITNAILAANNFGYAYDPIGNRISTEDSEGNKVYSANSLNQYTSITNGGLRTLSYDLDGNLTNDGHFAYTWDAENRLTSVISNGVVIASFKYDYMSRRYEKATAASTNTFVWDGWLPVCELSNPTTGNSTANFYVWGLDLSGSLQGAGGIGGLLSCTRGPPGTNWLYLADANGNITEVLDSANPSNILAHYQFDAYGNLLAASGPEALNNHFRFSSKCWDDETGLGYWGYRYYHPAEGRWTSRDQFGEYGGIDLYAYVCNSPMSNIDSRGLVVTTKKEAGKEYVDDTWRKEAKKLEDLVKRGVEEEVAEGHLFPGGPDAEVKRRLLADVGYGALIRLLEIAAYIQNLNQPPKVKVIPLYVSADTTGVAGDTIVQAIKTMTNLQKKECQHGIYIGHGPPDSAIDAEAARAIQIWNQQPDQENVFRRSRFAFFGCRTRGYNDAYHRIGYGYRGLGSAEGVNARELETIVSAWKPRFQSMLDKMFEPGCCNEVNILLFVGEDVPSSYK